MTERAVASERYGGLLAGALAVWVLIAAMGMVLSQALGHDEAAFAISARGDVPETGWLYRSAGTVALARLGLALGTAPWQLRLPVAGLNALAVIGVFALGRAAFRARTGAWAAAVLAGAHPLVLRNTELLSDVPAMACVLMGLAIVVRELEHSDGPRGSLAVAAPWFAAAFYFRYGSAPIIAFALAVAGVLWRRRVLQRPLPVVATIALLALLITPHLAWSRAVTGSMFGVLKISAGMPRRAYVGEGLVTYLTSNPFDFYGALVAPVMIAGLIGAVRSKRIAAKFLGIVAMGQIVALGIQSHGQPRYVFIAVALLVVVGVDTLAQSRFARPRVALGLVATAWLGVGIAAPIYFRMRDDTIEPIVHAAAALRADTGGRRCAVFALIVPQLQWYSGCSVYSVALGGSIAVDQTGYAVSFIRWPLNIAEVTAAHQLAATPLPTNDARVIVWRLGDLPRGGR